MAPKAKGPAEAQEGAEPPAAEALADTQEEGAAAEEEKQPADTKEKRPEQTEVKELEEDAPADGRPRVDPSAVVVNIADSTLNVLPVANSKLLTTLTEGGLQCLFAGARASVGLKSGRYMFEVSIVELLATTDAHAQGRIPLPRQLARVGFSTAKSPVILSDGPDSVCFDSEGFFIYDKTRKKVSQKLGRDQTIAVVLNLDEQSANANTISLFRDGKRLCQPQSLPEKLIGKILYPTVSYKNVALHVNFGPISCAPLPFACRMLTDAAADDTELAAAKDGQGSKPEVIFPIGLPEHGFFDWVDSFIVASPGYTEISDRSIIDWASKSGLWRPKAPVAAVATASNDKPDMKFGIPLLDDLSVRRVINCLAPKLRRNYIVTELESNLIAAERKQLLLKFPASEFKRKAVVLMGEPPEEYTKYIQEVMLAEKQAKVALEKRKAAQEQERKRLLEDRKKKAEEAKRLKDAAGKKAKGDAGAEGKEEAPGAEEAKEQPEKMDVEASSVELSEEEKALTHRKLELPDMNERVLSKVFINFSLPGEAEGFDEVSYVWQTEEACTKLLKDWILQKKLTQKAEGLVPGEWFKQEWLKWSKTLQEWRKLQTEFRDPTKRKALIAKKKAEAKKKASESAAEGVAEGEEKNNDDEAEPMEINAEDIDVPSVQDVTDLGNGEPLFANFAYEDWTLLSTRYELHLLLHAFKKDLNDPDRPSFAEGHLSFYYNKYFKKTFSLKAFGFTKLAELVELIKDSLGIDEKSTLLQPIRAEDALAADFVRATEEHRRERQRRFDAGDETAELKFARAAPLPPRQPPAAAATRVTPSLARPAGYGTPATLPGGQKRPLSATGPTYLAPKQPRAQYGVAPAGATFYQR